MLTKLSEIVAPMVADLKARRENHRKQNRRQYWQAGATHGAVVELGYMTRKQALKAVSQITHDPIIYVDDERAFIAFGNPPAARQ